MKLAISFSAGDCFPFDLQIIWRSRDVISCVLFFFKAAWLMVIALARLQWGKPEQQRKYCLPESHLLFVEKKGWFCNCLYYFIILPFKCCFNNPTRGKLRVIAATQWRRSGIIWKKWWYKYSHCFTVGLFPVTINLFIHYGSWTVGMRAVSALSHTLKKSKETFRRVYTVTHTGMRIQIPPTV